MDLVSSSPPRLSRRALDVYARVLRSALDAVGEAVILIDEQDEILLCNRSFAQLAGLGPEYRLELHDLRAALNALGATVDETELGRLLDSAGGTAALGLHGARTVLCAVTPLSLDEHGDCRMITFREITLQRRELHALEHRALHDDLSGLPGRGLLMDRLQHALDRQRREGKAVGVVFLDLDRFKEINDRHGHAAGDRVLIDVASRLRGELRGSDTICRLGGDEFVVVCEGLETERALAAICERIQSRLRQPHRLDSEVVSVTPSIGALLEWDHTASPSDVIERADALMYAAKQRSSRRELLVNGRPSRPAGQPRSARGLRRAIEAAQLFLAYLPIVAVDTERTIAVEGLLRSKDADLAGLAPCQLVELVEHAGTVEHFDRWALGEATRAARVLAEATGRPVGVFLNLSPTQLAHGAVTTAAAEAAARHGIDTRLIGFDIAQPLLAGNPPTLTQSIAALHALGCWLLMDDVTAPEVNPQWLRELGFAGFKLDRSVIGRSVDDERFAATVSDAVSDARSQGLSVVGEGVDDERRIQVVRELGCDGAQGFGFYGFPRAIEALLKVID